MIKSIDEMSDKIQIDLTGPQGNAFFLLGQAARLCKQLKLPIEKVDEIKKEMTASDYEHLVQTFDKHFGDYVILYRKQ